MLERSGAFEGALRGELDRIRAAGAAGATGSTDGFEAFANSRMGEALRVGAGERVTKDAHLRLRAQLHLARDGFLDTVSTLGVRAAADKAEEQFQVRVNEFAGAIGGRPTASTRA